MQMESSNEPSYMHMLQQKYKLKSNQASNKNSDYESSK